MTFADFWAVCENKTDKAKAHEAYDRALAGRLQKQRKGYADTPTHEVLVEAMKQYQADNPDWRALKMPATWLNNGCWMDYAPDTPEETKTRLTEQRRASDEHSRWKAAQLRSQINDLHKKQCETGMPFGELIKELEAELAELEPKKLRVV